MPEQESTQTTSSDSGEVKLLPVPGTELLTAEQEEQDEEENAWNEYEKSAKAAKAESESEDNAGDSSEAESTESSEDEGTSESAKEEPSNTEETTTKEKPVSFADFLKEKGEGQVDAKTKSEPAKKEVVSKTTTAAEQRDYSDIEEADVEYFKRMSNEAYAKMKPLYVEHKQLKQAEADYKKQVEDLKKAAGGQEVVHPSLYSHPQGYTLTKEYQTRSARAQLATSIVQHWRQQIQNVKNGKEWHDLVQDDKGQIMVSQEAKQPSDEVLMQLETALDSAKDQASNFNAALNSYQGEFKTAFDKDIQYLNEAYQQYFPGYDKEDHPTAKIQKGIIDALPESQRDNPLAKLVAAISANNIILINENKQLKEEKLKTNGKKETAVTKQPLKREMAGGGGQKERVVHFTDFARERD